MRTILAASFAASFVAMGLIGVVGISASQAMPVAPLDEVAAESSMVTTTFGGCGFLGHRGPFGGCRPLFSCPPGWHTGPFGRVCVRY
jgi:hypothetical protein